MRALTLSIGLFAASITAVAQEQPDSTGLPGDHFSLQGALELFKEAKDMESFEQLLNTTDRNVNNLDLNADGEVDYVRVIDTQEGDAHAIIVQVSVSETENQDVAVIELEKNGEENALLQIRGDEDLYGPDAIIEPFEEKEAEDGKRGPSAPELVRVRVVVNVWAWPSVRWIYGPNFVLWVSPWGWHRHPHWWKPWRPHPWRVHHGHVMHFHTWYQPVHVCRVTRAHAVYSPRRTSSVTVRNRVHAAKSPKGKAKDPKALKPGGRKVNKTAAPAGSGGSRKGKRPK